MIKLDNTPISKHNPFGNGNYKFFYACQKEGIEDNKEYIKNLYLSGLSCNAIAEHFYEKYKISTSIRNINNYVHNLGITRNKSSAKRIAINSGRMVYRKKPEIEKYYGKYISAGIRLSLLEENEFKCSLCGNGRHNGYSIEIHHKDKNPQNNDHSNLQVVCFLCHRGIHAK